MFPSLGLFAALPCPDHPPRSSASCRRTNCLFSHPSHLPLIPPSTQASRPSHNTPIPFSNPSIPSARPAPQNHSCRLPRKPSRPSSQVNSLSNPLSSYSPSPASLLPPRIQISNSFTPHTFTAPRQKLLDSLYDTYRASYSSILNLPDQLAKSLAHRDSLQEELDCIRHSSPTTYRNMVINRIVSIKKRKLILPPALSLNQDQIIHFFTGSLNQFEKNQIAFHKFQQHLHSSASGHPFWVWKHAEKLNSFILSKDLMSKLDYVVEIPQHDPHHISLSPGHLCKCERCPKQFSIPHPDSYSPEIDQECEFHWAKPVITKIGGLKQRLFTCCNETSSKGCTQGRHVFVEKLPAQLHARTPFVRLLDNPLGDGIQPVRLAAIDCELIYTSAGLILARVTIVTPCDENQSGFKIVLDEFVRIGDQIEIWDLNTRFSGIQSEDQVRKAQYSLTEIRDQLLPQLGIVKQTILCGHGLENDLKAMRIVHDRCIDTVDLFPHPRGLPMRMSLKKLSMIFLNKFIQDQIRESKPKPKLKLKPKLLKPKREGEGESLNLNDDQGMKEMDDDGVEEEEEEEGDGGGLNGSVRGHDSLEDACVALELVKYKLEQS